MTTLLPSVFVRWRVILLSFFSISQAPNPCLVTDRLWIPFVCLSSFFISPPSLPLFILKLFLSFCPSPVFALSFSTVTSLKAQQCVCTTWQTSGGCSWVPTPTEMDPTTSGCLSKGGCPIRALALWVSTQKKELAWKKLHKETLIIRCLSETYLPAILVWFSVPQ